MKYLIEVVKTIQKYWRKDKSLAICLAIFWTMPLSLAVLFAVAETELVFWTYQQYVASKHWSSTTTAWRNPCLPRDNTFYEPECRRKVMLVGYMVDGQQYIIKESPALFNNDSGSTRPAGITNVVLYNPKRPEEAVVKTHSKDAAITFGIQFSFPFVMYGLWKLAVRGGRRLERKERLKTAQSIDPNGVRRAAQAAVRTVLSHADPVKKKGKLHFAQSAGYCDSFIEFAWGKDGSISYVNIGLTLRPRSPGGQWLGYSVNIDDPQANPLVTDASEWYESSEAREITGKDLATALHHVEAVCQTPLSLGNQKPLPESPEGMY